MLVENTTPFAGLGFEQWHRDGQAMAVIAARGRFRLVSGGLMEPLDAPDLVLNDRFAGNPHSSDLLAVSDLVPFKPATDLTCLGTLHAPEPQRAIVGGLRVGRHTAIIRGTAPRQWIHAGRSWRLTNSGAITEIDLSYTSASGGRFIGDPHGRVDPRNPIGPGLIDPNHTPTHLEIEAPRIDSKHVPISLDHRNPAPPQGFGPVPPWWQARQRFVGSYDQDVQAAPGPGLPVDFDYRFYQCAHPNLVMAGFLSGDEMIETAGLLPGGRKHNFRLPGLQPWGRFQFSDGREVRASLRLDGVHLDFRGDEPVADLTWRAWMAICPAFYRVDLHHGPLSEIRAKGLPVSGLHGLEEVA